MPQPNTDRDSDGDTYSYADSKRYAYSNSDTYSYRGTEVYADTQAARHASSTPISSSLVG